MTHGTVETAIFAAGCFWGVEATYRQLKGIISTQVGYIGGKTKNPTYREVCSNKTGHAEAVEIIFDSNLLHYDQLVEIFFQMHDPTQLNRQGPDIGSQYRSAIFYLTPQQKQIAENIRNVFQTERYKTQPIQTEITRAGEFFPAEEYHQQYFEKNGYHSCVNFLKITNS